MYYVRFVKFDEYLLLCKYVKRMNEEKNWVEKVRSGDRAFRVTDKKKNICAKLQFPCEGPYVIGN